MLDDLVWRCYYCGEAADTIDHVVPRSMLKDLQILDDPQVREVLIQRNRLMEVDSCRDCNNRLGNTYSQTLSDRRELLKSKLRKKYANVSAMEEWTDSELGRLGPTLQQAVIARLELRDRIRKRLSYNGPATRYGARLN